MTRVITKNDSPADVLVVDDDAAQLEAMAEGLSRAGHRVRTARTGPDAIGELDERRFDVVVTDLVLGGATDGLAVMRAAHERRPDTQVIIFSAHGDIPTAVGAVKMGAFNFLEKPLDLDGLRFEVNRAAKVAFLDRENREQRGALAQRAGFEGILGDSPALREAMEIVRRVGPTTIPVLVTGPNGAGKELMARAVHRNSPRANRRFVAVNVAAVPESLVEEELFGHVRGVFTDAKSDREGKFEYADGGTLFLDEIGDMPLRMQAKLLRALETGEVVRIGSHEPVRVDVRVVAATNKDLERLIAEGQFREDLYYRVAGVEVRVPGLAERREDIRPLAEHYLAEACRVNNRPPKRLAADALAVLEAYHWPGNIRELRNVVAGASVLSRGDAVTAADLPAKLRARMPALPAAVRPPEIPALPPAAADAVRSGDFRPPLAKPDDDGDAARTAEAAAASAVATAVTEPDADEPVVINGRELTKLERIERLAVMRALEKHAGNRAKAARELGMGERTLYRKLRDYALA
jgi:two-component system response regulator HydG